MWHSAAPLLAALLLCAPLAAEDAGKVARVLPAGFMTRGASTAEAMPADAVLWNDILRTNEKGRLGISLLDGSLLSLGSKAELRVVRHDPQSQQTLAELLYGRIRSKVVQQTKPGSGFLLRTPTAVIGAIGTEFAAEARLSATAVTAISSEQIDSLPSAGRSISSLLQIPPDAVPGSGAAATLADFRGVDETIVFGLERITGVANIDPAVKGLVYLLPGEFTIVRRGQPPTPPRLAQPQDLPLGDDPEQRDAGCSGFVDLSQDAEDGKGPKYTITGLGTSTGDIFKVELQNFQSCPLDVYIPHGTVLKPKGFAGRVIAGLLGGGPPLKDFQKMMTEGSTQQALAPSAPAPGGMHFTVPESGQLEFTLKGYCVELEKLPPTRNTEYRFAPPGESSRMEETRQVMHNAYRLFLTREARPTMSPLDSLVQWSVWAFLEKMDEKEFRKKFLELVEKNLKAQ
ncbi:MAG: FecR domain-containing protein, partial [Terriglobales bacterium]